MSSRVDLATLIRARQSVFPTPGLPQSQPPAARAANVSLDRWGELLRYSETPSETGGVTSAHAQAGSFPCALYEYRAPIEDTTPGLVTESSVSYSLHLPRQAHAGPQDRFAVPAWYNTWQPGQAVAAGQLVIPDANQPGYVFRAVNAGTTGSTEPAWSLDPGTNTGDNGIAWMCVNRCWFFEIVGVNEADSSTETVALRVSEIS